MENLNEEGRGFRSRKKQTDPFCCPVCGVTVRASELEQHMALEMERLVKLQLNPKIKKSLNNGNSYHEPLPGCSSNGDAASSGCPWVTFQKIRGNRHSRLRIKTRKRKSDGPICPICNERPTEDINVHVELCLRKSENKGENPGKLNGSSIASDDDESIDIEGEAYDEYEWAGHKRVRASSLLQGGYSAVGIGTSISHCSDDDEDLNVDGDDTQIYGPPQYTERDIIVPMTGECEKEDSENIYLRKLVTGHDVQTILNSTSGDNLNAETAVSCLDENSFNNNNRQNDDRVGVNYSLGGSQTGNQGQIIECLKVKIREYENQISHKLKCLICMDEFKKPAVSICCWHVHCEECWLRTLGARKLCPQCNMITSPSDLRRIYM